MGSKIVLFLGSLWYSPEELGKVFAITNVRMSDLRKGEATGG
jgi:hypothetical protein